MYIIILQDRYSDLRRN